MSDLTRRRFLSAAAGSTALAVLNPSEFRAHAPLNLIYVADFSRLGNKTDDKKLFYSAADTGFISQNVYLFCAAFGLGTVVRDWIDKSSLAAKIPLREEQRIILAQTVGYPK